MITISDVARHFNVHPADVQCVHKKYSTIVYGFNYTTRCGVKVYVTFREFCSNSEFNEFPDLFIHMSEFALGLRHDLLFQCIDIDKEGLEGVDLNEIDRLAMSRLLCK